MCGARHVGVGQDGQKLRRSPAEDAGCVDVTDCTREGRCHRLQRFLRRTGAVGLDEQNPEVALVAVRARELVFEHRAHESIVEQARRAVDDVQRLRGRIVDLDPT